jgi:hypothetical protein
MAKDKMAEIKVPARWIAAFNEIYQTLGWDFDEEVQGWLKAGLQADICEIPGKERIRMVEKYNLSDVYEIPQWVRDEAAGIKRKPEPIPQIAPAKDPVASEALVESLAPFAVKVAWKLLNGMTLEEIEKFKSLTPEELDERLKTPLPHCSEDSTGVPA